MYGNVIVRQEHVIVEPVKMCRTLADVRTLAGGVIVAVPVIIWNQARADGGSCLARQDAAANTRWLWLRLLVSVQITHGSRTSQVEISISIDSENGAENGCTYNAKRTHLALGIQFSSWFILFAHLRRVFDEHLVTNCNRNIL